MGALINEDYAKKCLDELNEAVKINPSMFREDKVKSFYEAKLAEKAKKEAVRERQREIDKTKDYYKRLRLPTERLL